MKKTRNFDICQIRPMSLLFCSQQIIFVVIECGSLQISYFLFYPSPTCCTQWIDMNLGMNLHYFLIIFIIYRFSLDDLCRTNELGKGIKFRLRCYAYHADHENHDSDSCNDHASVTCFSFQLMARDTVIKR